MKDSIIFDLDGTLWDCRKVLIEVWNDTFRKYGLPVVIDLEKLTPCLGLPLYEIGKRLLPDVDEKTRNAITEASCREQNVYLSQRGGILYPQLKETLKELKKEYKLFIVSNCKEGYIESFLHAHGAADLFDDTENNGRTGLGKDGNIRLIMERNGLKAPVYVGDTVMDMEASKKAGIPFIFAVYGFGNCDSYAAKINSFSELKDAMKGFK